MPNRPEWEVQSKGSLEALPQGEPVCDSRGEVRNKIFVCIEGERHDGHTDAAGVLRRGAAAIVTGKKLGLPREYTVPDPRAALGLLAARYWGEPAAALRLIGITGTNGKTTTAHLLHHLLQSAGIKTGRIGTDGICWGEHRLPNPYTTPPPTLLHRVLRQMAEDGVTTVVMEVSSQALAQQRTVGLVFEAAVFTNLSPEHLDYHGDMERYFAEKEKLFSQCRRAVINTADPYGRRLAETVKVPVIPYHLPWQYHCEVSRSVIPWRGGQLTVPLTGEVFLPDALAAAEAAVALGLPPRMVLAAMPHCPQVIGRAELLWRGAGRTILRDYAHTPDALERILHSLRRIHRGRVLVLFGCGGDRDRQKRPLMAKAAARWADGVIITDDNPRSEAPEEVRREIIAGLPQNARWQEIPDRRQAIEQTIAALRQGDLLLLAGKGHEDYQILKDKTVPFDEKEIVTEILESGRIPWKNCHCEK